MEFLDVVDDEDRVVGSASYDDVYAKKFSHRIVHIFLHNSKGELALQLRSTRKSFCPLHWSTCVGGHVQAGETYEQAALRECHEELGVRLPIVPLRHDQYVDGRGIKKFLTTFKADHDGPFSPNPDEVERVAFFSVHDIKRMIASGEKFHPELLFLLRRQYGF